MFFGRYKRVILVCGVVLFAAMGASLTHAGGKGTQDSGLQPFTVKESIERTKIISEALFSPDGERFVFLTRRGDLARNVNIETILLYESAAVARYAGGKQARPPTPKALVSRDISHDWGYLANLKWLNNREIGFIAEGDNGQNQAFIHDIDQEKTTQLTHSPTHVTSFDVAGDRVIYYARTPVKQAQVVRVADQGLSSLLFAGAEVGMRTTMTPVEIFTGARGSSAPQKMNLPAMGHYDHSLWLSPSGRYAVALAPAVNAPRHWVNYDIPGHETFGFTPDKITADPSSPELLNRMRYWLFDLVENTSRPLLDAPSGNMAINHTPVRVFWPEDEQSVIVTNSFLPLKGVDHDIRKRRARGPAIAEIDLASGAVTTIAWEPVRTPAETGIGDLPERIVRFDWDSGQEILTLTLRREGVEKPVVQSYQREEGNWTRLEEFPEKRMRPDQVKPVIAVYQNRNQRPKLYVGAGDRRRILFDPNPGMDRYSFGRARHYRWRDENGIDWQGGLILPPDYEPGQRYPLVVQTHGYDPDEFLIDGPFGGTTAYSTQALANRGMVVLQVEDNNTAVSMDGRETERAAAGFKAAIDQLVREGIADSRKVGMTGFSRTGAQTAKFVALYPDYLAAYHLVDGSVGGWMDRLLFVHVSPSALQQIEYLFVGQRDVWRVEEWAARSSLYQLPKSRPAIRLGGNGPSGAVGYLELYQLLKQAGHAVEYTLYPTGSHVLRKPAERLASQQGSVDWYAFWLKGEEDPDPTKAGQYERWRALKAQHEKMRAKNQ